MNARHVVVLIVMMLMVGACASEAQPTNTPMPTDLPPTAESQVDDPTDVPPTASLEPTATVMEATATPNLSAIGDDVPNYGLEPFTYTQSIEGDYVGTEFNRRRLDVGPAVEYGPAVLNDNLQDEFVGLKIKTTVVGGDSDANRTADVIFRIARDTKPGTYELVLNQFIDDDHPIGVELSITNVGSFDAISAGTFTLDWFDEQFIVASYAMSQVNSTGNALEEVNIEGSVYLIEYTPAMDFDLTMTGAYEMTGVARDAPPTWATRWE